MTTSEKSSKLDLPLEFDLGDGGRALITESESGLRMLVEHPLDTDALSVIDSGWTRTDDDGMVVPIPGLDVTRSSAIDQLGAQDAASALSFVLDGPVTVAARTQDDRIVAETEEDRILLDRLGTDMPASEGTAQFAVRTFAGKPTPHFFTAILQRRPGVRLYADTLRNGTSVGRFRELWRVLESAFGSSDDDLLDALGTYAPALELAFDRAELERLLVLRGRASHANSRAEVGMDELINVLRECNAQVARLKCLVERVILTKEAWGYRTGGVDELIPLQSHVGPGGGVVYVRRS